MALAIRDPSTCTSRSRAWAWSTNSAMAGAVQTRPFSVDWVMVTMLGWEWCTSPRRATLRSSSSGASQAVVAGQPGELGAREPDGPPASSRRTWATSLQRISCHGWTAAPAR